MSVKEESREHTALEVFKVESFVQRAGQWKSVTNDGRPLIILEVSEEDDRHVKLKHFELRATIDCLIRGVGAEKKATVCLIACRSDDIRIQKFFLDTVGHVLARIKQPVKAMTVHALIEDCQDIFSSFRSGSKESLLGVMGELLFLAACEDAEEAAAAWHPNSQSLLDFIFADMQIEVKATMGRVRKHVITYDQLSCEKIRPSYLLSIKTQLSDTGINLLELRNYVLHKLKGSARLQHKVLMLTSSFDEQEFVAGFRLDVNFTLSNTLLFPFSAVPGIRDVLPIGVEDVRFSCLLVEERGSKLSGLENVITITAGLPMKIKRFCAL